MRPGYSGPERIVEFMFIKRFDSLHEAVAHLKTLIVQHDVEEKTRYEKTKTLLAKSEHFASFERGDMHRKFHLIYRKDCDDNFYILGIGSINDFLNRKFYEWELWDWSDPQVFFDENLKIWEFQRQIAKEMFPTLLKNSKFFIDGWVRVEKEVHYELEPNITVR